MKALLDLDTWVYRCGFAGEKTKYVVTYAGQYIEYETAKEAKAGLASGGILWSRKEYEPIENVLQMVKSSVQNTLDTLKVDSFTGYLSGRRNFRSELFPDYKANRDGAVRPRYYTDIREYMVRNFGAVIVDGFEADDALGMNAKGNILVTTDKDLDMIPGEHYNWVKQERYDVTARDGLKFWFEQLLTGDPTDNIPGLVGIGPVKAKLALKECSTPQDCAGVVYSMYRDSLGDAADSQLDRNAKLLWIWRKPNDEHPFFRHLGRGGASI